MGPFLATFIHYFIEIMTFAIIGRALISWIDPHGRWPISRLLVDVTEPILGPIRSVMPRGLMLDFSPIIAILLLQLIGNAIPR